VTAGKTRDGSEEYDHWATPKPLYDELDSEFHFDFDPCPLKADFDGLSMPWGKSNFINPPYNRIDKPCDTARGATLIQMTTFALLFILFLSSCTPVYQCNTDMWGRQHCERQAN
jgi:hypothetical protein